MNQECEKAWSKLQDWKNKQRLECLNSRAVFFEAFQAAYELREEEVKRLREALMKISEMSEMGSEESFARATQDDLMAEAANCFTYCKDIAKAALSTEETKEK